MNIKQAMINILRVIRETVGRLECRLIGHCDAMTDCIEIDPDMNYFYPCCRCGRDAISGQTFSQWADETRGSHP